MFYSPDRRLSLIGLLAIVFVLNMLLAGCGEDKTNQPTPIVASSTSSSPTPSSNTCQHFSSPGGLLSLSGLGYGPYHGDQSPDIKSIPSSSEVEADMATLKSITQNIRIYSSTGPASEILDAAQANGIRVALGIWLGSDPKANSIEIAAGEQLASHQAVSSLIVGNEVLLRGDLTVDQLHTYLQQVKAKVGNGVPISMADDYNQWLKYKDTALVNDVDFITVHIYPFWGGVSIDCAIQNLNEAYGKVVAAFPHKKIVIGETGWPSAISPQPESLPGSTLCAAQGSAVASPTPTDQESPVASPTISSSTGDAIPSPANQALYLKDFAAWAQQKGVEYYYFDAFDESWKIHEKGVGTHWGLYQQDGQLKPALDGLLPSADPTTIAERRYLDVAVGGLEPGFDMGIDTSQHVYGWLTAKDGVFTLSYPANQQWGTMFVTVCKPVPLEQRQFSRDFSAYQSLIFDMSATVDGQCVKVGIKDWQQPDDGTEQKVDECLTTQWVTYTRPLLNFSDADLTHLYVVFEVIFQGASSITIQVRNIRYSPN